MTIDNVVKFPSLAQCRTYLGFEGRFFITHKVEGDITIVVETTKNDYYTMKQKFDNQKGKNK